MKDNISVFWRCNKTIFGDVLMFLIITCTVLYYIKITIPFFSIIVAVLLWAVVILTHRYREVIRGMSDSKSQDLGFEKEVLDMWYEIEPTWAKDIAVVISFLVSGLAFLITAIIKYNLFSAL